MLLKILLYFCNLSTAKGMIVNMSEKTSSENRDCQLLTRIESIPFSHWHVKPRVIIGTATFFDGFDSLALAYALPVLIGLWRLNTGQTGMLISAGYLGQAIGAVIFGYLAERFGRVFSIKISMFLMSIMGLLCMFAGSFNMLFALRFIQGALSPIK